MRELPPDLGAMMEAVEKYMGEQFTDMLAGEIAAHAIRVWVSYDDPARFR